jgi:hypothetical protein
MDRPDSIGDSHKDTFPSKNSPMLCPSPSHSHPTSGPEREGSTMSRSTLTPYQPILSRVHETIFGRHRVSRPQARHQAHFFSLDPSGLTDLRSFPIKKRTFRTTPCLNSTPFFIIVCRQSCHLPAKSPYDSSWTPREAVQCNLTFCVGCAPQKLSIVMCSRKSNAVMNCGKCSREPASVEDSYCVDLYLCVWGVDDIRERIDVQEKKLV